MNHSWIVPLTTVGCAGAAYWGAGGEFSVWSWPATIFGFLMGIAIAVLANRYDRSSQ